MSGTPYYDVIIVGAGAGGATAGYFLGQAGVRVILLEKASLPRYKPCGGAVPFNAYRHLPFDFSPVIECEVSRVSYCWQAGHEITFPLPARSMSMVMRDRFDAHILNHAAVTVWENTRVRAVEEGHEGVRVTTDAGDVIRAEYLIDASGAQSSIARMLGLRIGRVLGAAIEAEVVPDDATFERYAGSALFDFGVISHGYVWVFAKRNHLSVGIGVLDGKQSHVRETLEREMKQLGVNLAGIPLHGHTLPVYQGPEPRHTSHAMLVGDAAGLLDPLSGEGIRHAIVSGRLAAKAILEGRINQYSTWIERYARRALRPMQTLAKLFYQYPSACFHYGVHNPRATRALTAWVNGALSAAQLMSTLALCFVEGLIRRR